ncbi:hypothetical protein Btru_036394 [Bulinus truncatus]|nr:hypothetical protein Btru_036394 [Bulinus truncatus]
MYTVLEFHRRPAGGGAELSEFNLNRTYVATDIRNDLLIPTDPNDSPGSFLRKFVINPRTALVDSVINVTHSMVSVADCAQFCLQENTFSCETFDYKFTTGFCRLTSIHPDEITNSSTVLKSSVDTNVYSRLYTDEYTMYDSTEFTTTGDKIIQGITSDEMCAKSCTSNSDFTCESFDYCTNANCILRKQHKFDASMGPLQAFQCNHYSRNHLYDYILRDQKTLQLQFSSVAKVDTAEECAELCSSGDGLPSCATFTVCSVERGDKQCSMTSADPTVSKDIIIQDSLQCSLYTRANPLAVISTTVNGASSTSTSKSTSTLPTTKLATTTMSSAPTSTSTFTSAISTAVTGANKCSQMSDSSDTGARVGIAFGTLFLGLIVGALCIFLFMRHQINKPIIEDVQIYSFQKIFIYVPVKINVNINKCERNNV